MLRSASGPVAPALIGDWSRTLSRMPITIGDASAQAGTPVPGPSISAGTLSGRPSSAWIIARTPSKQRDVEPQPEDRAELRLHEHEHVREQDRDEQRALEVPVGGEAVVAQAA